MISKGQELYILIKLKEIPERALEEIRTIVWSIITILVFVNGHGILNKLFETPDSFIFYYITLPLALVIPPMAINLWYFKKHLHKSKISLRLRIGLGLWLSLIIVMNMIPISLSLLIELPYHTHWPVGYGYYQGKNLFTYLELIYILPISIYNFILWRKRVLKECRRLYQAKIPIFSKSWIECLDEPDNLQEKN